MTVTKIFTVLFLQLGSAVISYATWQRPDILVYQGKAYNIYDGPLETYFKKFPDRKPTVCERNSGLWRGYIAEIEVIGVELILKDVKIPITNSPEPECQKESVLSRVVPDGKPLKLDWMSQIIVSMNGRNDGNSYSLSFLDTFETYSLFEVDKGNLKKALHFNNKEFHAFKKGQFEAFKKTKEYNNEIERMMADGKLRKSDADANIKLWIFYKIKTLFLK